MAGFEIQITGPVLSIYSASSSTGVISGTVTIVKIIQYGTNA